MDFMCYGILFLLESASLVPVHPRLVRRSTSSHYSNCIRWCFQASPSICVICTSVNMRIHLISNAHDRDWPVDRLKDVKVADALKHPNWNMGKKITVDSATLFNKVS
jgi:hypothetical protein